MEKVMKQCGMRYRLRVAVTLLASSTMIALAGAGSTWASTPLPPSPAASPLSLADAAHGLLLAQATEGTSEQEQKAMEDIRRGIQEEEAGMREEQKGVREEQRGLRELEDIYSTRKMAPGHGG
jgi:hypothetical protein